jgi:hypothetical protein
MEHELTAILDITSLIRLAAMMRLPDMPKEERVHVSYKASDVDTAIEALVLYDSVLLDGRAWETNLEILPELTDFSRFCQSIPISPERERQNLRFVNRQLC